VYSVSLLVPAVDTAGNKLSNVIFFDCPEALFETSKKSVLAALVLAKVDKSVTFAILYFFYFILYF
jgi:hypothetical protein